MTSAPLPARRADAAEVVRATVVCFLGALLTAATLYPTYRAPDEIAHVDQVHAVRTTWSWPRLGERQLSRRVVDSFPLVGYREDPPLASGAAVARSERPPFGAVAPDEPTPLGNQMSQHPPLYYVLAAGWLALLDVVGPVAFDLEVWWLRLLGALLVAPLPWLAARTANAVGHGPPVVAGAAVAVLAVPMVIHIGSAVNNDVLLIALAGVATLHAAAVAGGDVTRRHAAWLGVAVGAALLTKLFAVALVPLMVAAPVVAWSRGLVGRRAALLAGLTSMGVATVVGGWWWLRNLVVHGTVQPSGAAAPPTPEGFVPDLGWWAPFAVARLVRRWWIEPDTVARTTPPLIVAATVAGLTLLAAAFVRRRRVDGRATVGRRELAVLLLPFLGCLLVVAIGGWRAYARTGIPFAIHGRYLYPGLVGVAVVAAAGAAAVLRRRAPAVLLAGAGVLQLTAAWWALTYYWGVPDATAPLASLRAWLAWSPLPPAWTVLPAFVAAGGGVWAGVLAWPARATVGNDTSTSS